MRLLFVKESLGWPRTVGHDVHAFEMMRAMGARGHAVGLATVMRPEPKATDGLALDGLWALGVDEPEAGSSGALPDMPPMTYLQERYRRYWGIDLATSAGR
jgi:hypothetical protein